MIHHHVIGDARITGVIEYSGPTHDPAFLYPAIEEAERDAVLKANAGWLAPDHYVPHMDRLIVTIQIWVVKAGGNVILIDTGVGNRKPRASAARMDQLNTLTMPWLEAAGAGPEQVTHVVHTHLHTDHVGWNTVLYLSALQTIPGELYEAAKIDGANGWQQFRLVILPLLKPMIFLAVTLSIIGGLQLFEEPFILLGDFNIIPAAIDATSPEKWVGDALFRPESHERWRALLNLGMVDAQRAVSDEPNYTFWDFKTFGWDRQDGIRIDHLLLSPQAADRLDDVLVHREVRGWDKPSDHVPVEASFVF